MNYTDKQLLRAAQVAYYDINSNIIDDIYNWIEQESKKDNGITASYTLSELFNHSTTFKTSIYRSIAASLGDKDFKLENYLDSAAVLDDIKDRAKYVAIEEVYNIIDELQSDKDGSIGSWKLVSYVFNDDIGVKGVAGKLVDGAWVTDYEFICLCRITPRRNTAGHSFARNLRKNPVSACKSQQNVVY